MNDSFDQELRRSLRHRADRIPRRPNLSTGAIARARGIRRRRQVAGVVAAAALVAVAVPVGLRVGDAVSHGQDPVAPADSTPTTDGEPSGNVKLRLDLRELAAGDSPAIPYLDGRTVVGDGFTARVPGSDPIAGVAPTADGAYVATGPGVAGWTLTRYAADGRTEDLGTVLAPPVASADGRWVAYPTGDTDRNGNPVGEQTLVLVDTETGASASATLDSPLRVGVHAIVDGAVYFDYDTQRGRRVPLQVWSAGDAGPQQVLEGVHSTAVSSDGRLITDLRLTGNFGSCSTVLDRETGGQLMETCKHQIHGFSPDGRYAWTGPAYADGYAATTLGIVDVRTGSTVRNYVSDGQVVAFLDATFEDGDSLLIRAEQNGKTALLRCDVRTGDCETAAPLARGTTMNNDSPYLLSEAG